MSEFNDLKGLEWQVNIRHQELYYVGRGGTPALALADLVKSAEKGIAHAEEQMEGFKRKALLLREAIEKAAGM